MAPADREIRTDALASAAMRLSGNDWYRQRPRDEIAAETIELACEFEEYLRGEWLGRGEDRV